MSQPPPTRRPSGGVDIASRINNETHRRRREWGQRLAEVQLRFARSKLSSVQHHSSSEEAPADSMMGSATTSSAVTRPATASGGAVFCSVVAEGW